MRRRDGVALGVEAKERRGSDANSDVRPNLGFPAALPLLPVPLLLFPDVSDFHSQTPLRWDHGGMGRQTPNETQDA